MPWKIVKADQGYFVVNQHTGKKMSRRPLTHERAAAQLRALHANVHDFKERAGETASINTKSIKFGRRYRRGAWGNMQGLAKHLAHKYGGDPHFFTKVFNSDELKRVVLYKGKPYTKQQRAKIAALAHKYVTGIWPGEHRGKNPNGPEKKKEFKETQEDGSILVFKERSGKYRWVAISSNAFKDRDGEIVSLKALEADVERANRDHDYGPLRWWHVDGADIGDTDFNLLYSRTLIESGTFRSKEIAEAVLANSDKLRISIGFRHPVTEPDHEGVFSTIRRFERSTLPRDAASNTLTGILVTRS